MTKHLTGPESPQALRSLEKIDAGIGRLRKAVETAGVGGETRWLIVSDHGFYAVEKAFHPDALLASLGLSADGDAKNWRVAAHAAGGSAAFHAKDPNDREAQTQVTRMLKRLKEEGGFGLGGAGVACAGGRGADRRLGGGRSRRRRRQYR